MNKKSVLFSITLRCTYFTCTDYQRSYAENVQKRRCLQLYWRKRLHFPSDGVTINFTDLHSVSKIWTKIQS